MHGDGCHGQDFIFMLDIIVDITMHCQIEIHVACIRISRLSLLNPSIPS